MSAFAPSSETARPRTSIEPVGRMGANGAAAAGAGALRAESSVDPAAPVGALLAGVANPGANAGGGCALAGGFRAPRMAAPAAPLCSPLAGVTKVGARKGCAEGGGVGDGIETPPGDETPPWLVIDGARVTAACWVRPPLDTAPGFWVAPGVKPPADATPPRLDRPPPAAPPYWEK